MSLEHFNICTNELLKSLEDGIDLPNSAAEYIIAFENTDVPSDILYKSLKVTAEEIILKEDEKTKLSEDELTRFRQGQGYLLAQHHTHGEPTQHVWQDGLQTPEEANNRFAVWPYYNPKSPRHPYQKHHFPFHELNHPLRRQTANGVPHFVELLRSHVFNGHIEEERDFEKALLKHLPSDHPLKAGYQKPFAETKTKLIGDLNTAMTINRHQEDFYNRDYHRWKRENSDLQDEFIKNGLNAFEAEEAMRHAHFNDRAADWVSNEHFKTGSEYMDDVEYHPKNLGHRSYMYGLEWFSPEERTAIQKHIEEKGLDEHDEIKLPNGEKIPSARLIYNKLMRMTPEKNWAIRKMKMPGRNAHFRQESNDVDYHNPGEDRFFQQSLGRIAHTPLDELGERSLADYILDEINNQHEANREAAGHHALKYLPRLRIGKEPMKEMDWPDLREASYNHFRTVKKDGNYGALRKKRDIANVRMTKDDLMYLAGYDPISGNLLENHPIHGEMDGPIVDSGMINMVVEMAKRSGSLHSQIKDLRNHRAFFTATHGPHPEEEKPEYWKVSKDGTHTYGPGKFWSQPFQNTGGGNMTLATYIEMIHAAAADEDGMSDLFDIQDTGTEYIHANPNNTSLAYHFMPEKQRLHGVYDITTKKYVYPPDTLSVQNLLSPMNVSVPYKHNSGLLKEPLTDKNNFTEHKSSLSPQYEYVMRFTNKKDREKYGSHLEPNTDIITNIPNVSLKPQNAFGANPSDNHIHKNARHAFWLNKLTGRNNHPNNPAKKSIVKFNDYMRGDSGLGDEDADQFAELMGWGNITQPNYDNMKNMFIDNPKHFMPVRIVNTVAKILNTTNPKQILDYLEGDDHHELKSAIFDSQHSEINFDDLGNTFDDIIFNLNKENEQKRRNQKTKTTVKAGVHDAINRMIRLGGMLPSFEKETELTNYLDNLSQEFTGLTDPEEKEAIAIRISETERELAELQRKGMQKVLGSKANNFWKIEANTLHDLANSHRNLVAEVARDKIIPAMIEARPDAFDTSNPQQYIDNTMRAFRDAQRYIMTVPHDVHGLQALGYGISKELKANPKQDKFHLDMANHLKTHGTMIDPNMSDKEIFDALNISERSPMAKQMIANLRQKSSGLNTPLAVATIKDIITHGNIKDIRGVNIEDLHHNEELANKDEGEVSDEELFYHKLHNSDYHTALMDSQTAFKESDWKGHFAHAVPRRMMGMLNPQQFDFSMQAAGIGMITGDVHNMQGLQRKGKDKVSRQTKNYLDTIVHYNPTAEEDEFGLFTPPNELVEAAGLRMGAVGAPSPNNFSIMDTFDSGAWHGGHECNPNVGCDFDSQGNIVAGTNPGPGLFYGVPEELLDVAHGKGNWNQVWENAPPPQYTLPPFLSMNYDTFETPSEVPTRIAMSEMTEIITSLLDPDILLTKSDEAAWSPAVRPMHRIFDMKDLEHLKGFSGSWVVSKWYDGQRVIIVKNGDEVTAYNESGKKKGLRKATKEALGKINDNNFTIDGILGEEDLNIIDILNYDDNNISDMQLYERLKILRSQFESHENVIVPGPHDTRMTDDEGLEDSVNNLKEEHDNILLRDNKSTYMKGERRHPKWVLYRSSRDYNFIILDRRGKGPYTYQLGAGPINHGEELGNRAIEHDGNYYMDVGTAHNQQKVFKIGDIVRASITGVTKKNRKERAVYNVQFKEIESEGEGEGAASVESLDLLTKSFAPILIPHDIEVDDNHIQIIMKDIDVVNYSYEQLNDAWYIHSPTSAIGSLKKTDYPVVLAESLLPFWSPVAPLMITGNLRKEKTMDMPKKPSDEKVEEQSVGIIDADDEDMIIKPEDKKKALEIIVRALDAIAKEKMTWTGPKGLGIDVGTPQESPRGPTQLRNESTLPDFDGEKKNNGEKKEGKKERLNHIQVNTDEGENLSIDYDNDQPIVSQTQS